MGNIKDLCKTGRLNPTSQRLQGLIVPGFQVPARGAGLPPAQPSGKRRARSHTGLGHGRQTGCPPMGAWVGKGVQISTLELCSGLV